MCDSEPVFGSSGHRLMIANCLTLVDRNATLNDSGFASGHPAGGQGGKDAGASWRSEAAIATMTGLREARRCKWISRRRIKSAGLDPSHGDEGHVQRDSRGHGTVSDPDQDPSRATIQAFGDTNQDLVYKPFVPCRYIDTRNVVEGKVQPPPAPSRLRAVLRGGCVSSGKLARIRPLL